MKTCCKLTALLLLSYCSDDHSSVYLSKRFSKRSVRSPRAQRDKPRGSARYSFTY